MFRTRFVDIYSLNLPPYRENILMKQQPINSKLAGPESPHFSTDSDNTENVAPWTEVEEGRFMPRRTRGSNPGRALG